MTAPPHFIVFELRPGEWSWEFRDGETVVFYPTAPIVGSMPVPLPQETWCDKALAEAALSRARAQTDGSGWIAPAGGWNA